MTDDDLRETVDRLESLVEQQQETIERQQEQIEALRGEQEGDDAPTGDDTGDERASGTDDAPDAAASDASESRSDDGPGITTPATRRGVLTAGGVLGLLGLGAGTASADPSGQIGTDSDELGTLFLDKLDGDITGDTELTNLVGPGLSINSGSLDASGASAWTGGDAGDLLEPSSGSKVGVEVDKIADDGSGQVTMQSNVDLNSNNLNSVASIDNGGSAITVGDNLDLDAGSINNGFGTDLRISAEGLLVLDPSTTVDFSSSDLISVNRIDSSGALDIDTETPSSDPVRQSAPDTGNVGTGDLSPNPLAFALNESNTELDAYVKDSDGTSGQIANIGSYSTERLKADIQPYAADPETVLDIEAKTFTAGDGDGDDRLGITAESAHDAGLDWLVDYASVDDALQTEDGITDSYVEAYGIERDGETVVPNDIHDRAWLAMHQELLRDHREEIERKEERIADLETENDRLRERMAAIEAELGLDATADAGVADD